MKRPEHPPHKMEGYSHGVPGDCFSYGVSSIWRPRAVIFRRVEVLCDLSHGFGILAHEIGVARNPVLYSLCCIRQFSIASDRFQAFFADILPVPSKPYAVSLLQTLSGCTNPLNLKGKAAKGYAAHGR